MMLINGLAFLRLVAQFELKQLTKSQTKRKCIEKRKENCISFFIFWQKITLTLTPTAVPTCVYKTRSKLLEND